MNISEISNRIYYAGINNRTSELFEELWPIPHGVSYNSYVVVGDKIALIDTVPACYCIKFLHKIADIIGNKNIDYLVINHMEPDHSGAIQIIRNHFPEIKIIGNNKTAEMIQGYYGISDNIIVVKENDTIDLGAGKTMRFTMTPMVHWPETMMTYIENDKFLFSGDAFGCYGALNGAVTDDVAYTDDYIPEMYRYYSNIVAKYGVMVQNALKKLAPLEIGYICPTHGPVWHKRSQEIIDIYSSLSRYEAEPGVVIAYGSMYGNTEDIAELIARELTVNGVSVRMHNIATADLSVVLADIMRFKGLIIGAPTYNSSIFPPIQNLIEAIVSRGIKNRVLSTFGSYTWGPGISVKIEKSFESLNYDTVSCKIEMKQSILDNDLYNRIEEFAKVFAEKVK